MRVSSLVLLVYMALEIAVFVLLGQQFGFLLTIAIYLLISIVGFSLSRGALVRIAHEMNDLSQQSLSADMNDEDSVQATRMRALHRLALSKRMMFLGGAMLFFVLPGFITEVIAVLLLINGMKPTSQGTDNVVLEDSGSWMDACAGARCPRRSGHSV